MTRICLLFLLAILAPIAPAEDKPNILWIYAEDTSPWMGCYGSEANAGQTPNIDSIAERGIRFTRAFVPAPVCSACRSGMIVGQSQIRFGAHEHRSGRGTRRIKLPAGIQTLPEIMNANGYETFNFGKTDYNFDEPEGMYTITGKSKQGWFGALKDKQPFFGQIQTKGGKNGTGKFPASRKTDPAKVQVPADYPQNDLFHRTVAQHHDAIRVDDDLIGRILKDLEASGMADRTIVVYFSDHGANNLLRHKQMPTEGGLHVPFVVMGPEQYVPLKNRVRKDLVNMLDLTATTLAWAGVDRPDWYEGQHLFGADHQPRKAVFGAKDRLDHTIDRVRTVRSERFRYTRNFMLDRVFAQPQYRDRRPEMKNLKELYASGELAPHLTDIYFGERPAEELYDVSKDPAQIHNLVNDPAFKPELERHRRLLDEWIAKGDHGAQAESEAELRYNGEAKKWGTGVNVEYESYREDSDGDGLSDVWEKTNQRDPKDGLLLFEFDCGGWQTEGWKSGDIDNNLAGYLGYLEFTLNSSKGRIERDGMKLKTVAQGKALTIHMQTSVDANVTVIVNGKEVADVMALPTSETQQLEFAITDNWPEVIETLAIKFNSAAQDARIIIDRIAGRD